MKTRLPSSFRGRPETPRSFIGVKVDDAIVTISFSYHGGGHAELLTLAEAEALAERLLDHIEIARYDQMFGSPKAPVS